MKQKVLVAIAIIALILGILNLIFLLVPPKSNPLSTPPIRQLEVSDIKINGGQDIFGVDSVVIEVTVYLAGDVPTLFNCYVQADYLTIENVWKTTSKEIGIVNYSENVYPQLRLDTDFASEIALPSIGWQSYSGINLKVEAYGYLKP